MPHIFKKYYPWRNLLFVFGEGVLIFIIINSVFVSWVGFSELKSFFFIYFFRAFIVTAVYQICFYYFDLYDLKIIPSLSDHMLKVLQTFGFGCIVLAFIYYSFPFLIISNKIFWCGFFAVGIAVFFWRIAYFKILERRMFVQPIAVIGTGSYAMEIVDAIERKKDSGFKIIALVGNKQQSFSEKGLHVVENIADLREHCVQRSIGKIVVALEEKRGIPLYELIQYKFLGVEIVDGARFYEELVGKIPVKRINPSWLIFSDGFHVSRIKKLLKRMLDIVAALSGFLAFLPIFLISALIVKLESAGGVFYLQNRVGENGKIFKIIKFRSMKADAEKNGPVWASEDDCRVTKFGRFIRKTRIDEIPQLLNVLKGDMSLVGPRPERPEFVESLANDIPFYNNRHVIKPGITGWAQIYYPYGASVEDALHKLEYDFYYIKNLSIAIDILVILQTIKVMLFRKGSR
jgi:sugar transferase (PEP-CTERM system associated)